MRASQAMRTERRLRTRTLNFCLSALGLLLVFAVTAYAGVNIVAYERLEARVDRARGQRIDATLGSISAWKNTSGLATRARTLALQTIMAETPGDTAAMENALDELVKASPTSVAAWQALAAYQGARGAPIERVLPAFRMSALTGSHEGYYMAQRVMFGLQYWTELPESDRRATIRDLVGSAVEYGPDRYRNIVAGKSQVERDEIRAAILTSGRGSKALFQALGL
jgi:hypothetical protein